MKYAASLNILLFLVTCERARAISASQLCEREMLEASSVTGTPLAILYAVGLTESGRGGKIHPFALNIDGRAYFPVSAADASAKVEEAERAGARFIDVGCMQINRHFHGKHFATVQKMLEPRDNVRYAAKFLQRLRMREKSWTMALARYHAGPANKAAQRQYICRIIANLIRSGMGQWTRESRAKCNS